MGLNINSKSLSWISIGCILGIFVFGYVLPKGLNWFAILLLMIGFIVSIGWLKTGRLSGIFINERNKMSLSRFQLVLWTLIVLSAFLAIALERISTNVTDPLAIAIPEQLWILLGISTASLVGSPLILSAKIPKEPDDQEESSFITRKLKTSLFKKVDQESMKRILEELPNIRKDKNSLDIKTKMKPFHINNEIIDVIVDDVKKIEASSKKSGILDSNMNIEDANFSDLFTGEEKGNSGYVDVARLQMFFFTIVIAFSYLVLLVNLILVAEPTELGSFPELSDSLVALLGISSAGYLTSKPIDKTKIKQ